MQEDKEDLEWEDTVERMEYLQEILIFISLQKIIEK
jgi:hypothetical protein